MKKQESWDVGKPGKMRGTRLMPSWMLNLGKCSSMRSVKKGDFKSKVLCMLEACTDVD